MMKDIRKAERSKLDARDDLVEADDFVNSDSLHYRKLGRELRRRAKRRKSKAERRLGKIVCQYRTEHQQ
jgi:hypothetical protein